MTSRLMEKSGEFKGSLKKTDWAWIAGFIDGEGCIGINKGYTKNKNGNARITTKKGWYWYRPRLSLSNTDRRSVEFIANAFEVKDYKRKMTPTNFKSLYYIDVCGIQDLRRILPKIMSYLRVKAVQADLVYRLACLPRGSGSKKELLWREFDKYSEQCGQKRVGQSIHSKSKRRMLKRRFLS